ncbi:MAG TPA: hypothetical protein VGO62_12855, partial [Myxococcota bacterium]
MAQIDAFIRTMFENKSEAVGIATGHPPLLMHHGERKPLEPGVVQLARLEQLVGEVLNAEQQSVLSSVGRVELLHRTVEGTVKLAVRKGSGAMQLMISPASASNMPRGPLSGEGAPVATTPSTPPGPASPSAQAGPALQVVRASAIEDPFALKGGKPVDDPFAPKAPAAPSARSLIDPIGAAPQSSEKIDALFRELVKRGGSDLYVCTGKKALIRKDGELVPIGQSVMSEAEVKSLLFSITHNDDREAFERENDVDFAYEIAGLARFRANLFRDRNGAGAIFRTIPVELLTAEKLNLPQAILDLCNLNKGLVLVTGPTGSGKSTT